MFPDIGFPPNGMCSNEEHKHTAVIILIQSTNFRTRVCVCVCVALSDTDTATDDSTKILYLTSNRHSMMILENSDILQVYHVTFSKIRNT